ncbi:lipopolysaccharide biosynthesis protein [Emticicia sp. CRIBPO]|uniref:Wzz/FepE/Etk N-terminal domain-containing protein n=1 Tax=Emticicia sp. CRIBPO TaxID=2683258 RepID=UPI00141351B6|nr:Wzz/FepE/Etk N-terminal domain-containing protein [Emticicia sp. CRIBPO]NBA87093.1 lipopolysaccharide biosynthesis protein [Emticicia sp. CRIBPO]
MTEISQNVRDEVKINFGALPQIFRKEKWIFFCIILLSLLGGAYYAFTAREEFISDGKILPEVQSKGSGLSQFAGLASLAGVDLGSAGNSADAIRPDLYPDIINSTPFYIELLKTKVRTKDNREISFDYFYHNAVEKDKKFEDRMLNKFPVKENGILVLNLLNQKRIKDLRIRVNASVDRKSGLILITSKMPDPVVAADVAKFAIDYLTNYVTSYRTEKLRKEVEFLAERVAVSRGKFYSNQEKKAQYSDQFQAPTIRIQAADVQRERLESEYKISSSFYNELLKKYEEAKIRLNQETPVFKTLEPPVVPTLKSEPKKIIILAGAFFFGIISGLIIILLKSKNYKLILNSN